MKLTSEHVAFPAGMTLIKAAPLLGLFMAVAPGVVFATEMDTKGTTPYVTHFIFRA